MSLILFPAIDVSDGKAVRLFKGNLEEQTNYGAPKDVAAEFSQIYNSFSSNNEFWVHLVDLDAAFGRGNNKDVIAKTIEILKANDVNIEC